MTTENGAAGRHDGHETVYETIFRSKWLTDGASTPHEMVARLQYWTDRLHALSDAGVTLTGPVQDDYAYLTTTDPAVVRQFGQEFGFAPLDDDDAIIVTFPPRTPQRSWPQTAEARDRDIATALADYRAVVALAQLMARHHVDMLHPGTYVDAAQAVRVALPELERFLGARLAHEVRDAASDRRAREWPDDGQGNTEATEEDAGDTDHAGS
jgi:hypothetical protein